ncbi:diguanylate cyclase [bacterium]|nr:MAG: diguanylate cyclase [bacterium]
MYGTILGGLQNRAQSSDCGRVVRSTRSAAASGQALNGSPYERALAALSNELAPQGLIELTVWRDNGAALCSLDRAVAGSVERDSCDATIHGRPEGTVFATGRTLIEEARVIAPIAFEAHILGALTAQFHSPPQASAAATRIESAAERIAALLEIARLEQYNDTASRDWETVVETLQSIAGETDLFAVCDAVRTRLARAIDFDGLMVARTLPQSAELEAFYLYESGLPREVTIRIPLSSAGPGPTVAATGQALLFRHTSDWGKFGASQVDRDEAPDHPPASAIFTPLQAGTKTLGVVSLQSERPAVFGPRERALLEPIAEGLALAIARSRLQHASENARVERGVMLGVARALAQAVQPARIFEEVCRQTRLLVDSPDIFIALGGGSEPLHMVHHYHNGVDKPLEERDVPSPRMLQVARDGQPLICDTRAQMEAAGVPADLRPDLKSVAIVALRAGDTMLGVLHCGSPREGAYPASRADLLIAIGEQAGVALNNAKSFAADAERSNRDPLTNLLNHRAIMAGLERMLAERGSNVAVVLLDVEAFRLFNTTFGHHVGDEALRLVALCIRAACGSGDLAARYGGDEFLIALPDGGSEAAQAFLERLRAQLAASPLESPTGAPIPISCSAGIAVAPMDGTTRETLVACADERLESERNGVQVRISSASGRPHPELSDAQEGLLVAILRKDLYTRAHIHFVGETALDFAAALGLDGEMTRALFLGSLLHDVGKICIPDSIISKPSTLTSAERKIMQRHTMLGYELVRGIDGMDIASLAVLHHHERIDGHGYPYGLAGQAIPSIARLVTIIDAFSAMVLDRPYHKAISDDAAKEELRRCAGRQFDADYVTTFRSLFDS